MQSGVFRLATAMPVALLLLTALPASAAPVPLPIPRPESGLALSLNNLPIPLARPDTNAVQTADTDDVEPADADDAQAAPDDAFADSSAPVNIDGVKIEAASADDNPRIVNADTRLSCVPFARALSGIDIRGNAATWWAKAKGLYAQLTQPRPGAVMVFASTSHMRAGHVAVVKDVVSSREVRIDHANWGRDGRIYLNAPVVDVSRNNDWSEVRVWNTELGVLGSHIYKLSGFVAE